MYSKYYIMTNVTNSIRTGTGESRWFYNTCPGHKFRPIFQTAFNVTRQEWDILMYVYARRHSNPEKAYWATAKGYSIIWTLDYSNTKRVFRKLRLPERGLLIHSLDREPGYDLHPRFKRFMDDWCSHREERAEHSNASYLHGLIGQARSNGELLILLHGAYPPPMSPSSI